MILEFAAKGKKIFAYTMLVLLYLQMVLPSYAMGERISRHTISVITAPVDAPAPVPDSPAEKKMPAVRNKIRKATRWQPEDIGGPTQPESQAFHSVNDDNMVDLFSGDFSYNIPLLDVGGYPVALGYNSGISMDQEPSWVGLGWNINPGTITRNLRGVPDDFNGTDSIRKVAHVKASKTVGVKGGAGMELFGKDNTLLNGSIGIGVVYNNYKGHGIESSLDVSLNGGSKTMGQLTGGLSLTNSSQDGATVGVSLDYKMNATDAHDKNRMAAASASTSLAYNTRSGLRALQLSGGVRQYGKNAFKNHGRASLQSTFSTGISFAHPSFTPTITLPYTSSVYSFSAKAGSELTGLMMSLNLGAHWSTHEIAAEDTAMSLPAYGYLNYQAANGNTSVLLDYNREKDMAYREKPAVPTIAVPAYTYDVFSISGEGTGGMFRAYRGDIGYVYDHQLKTKDKSMGASAELGVGNAYHWGVDLYKTHAYTENGPWQALNGMTGPAAFRQSKGTFEAAYFRNPGEKTVNDQSYYNTLGGDDVVAVSLSQANSSSSVIRARNVLGMYRNKQLVDERILTNRNTARTERDKRTQVISYLTAAEASTGGLSKYIDNYKENTYSLQNCELDFPEDLGVMGLRGDYYWGTNFRDYIFTRIDTVVAFAGVNEINVGRPTNISRMVSNFSVRWTGRIKADVTGAYQIITHSDDGIRLYLNDTLFIDRWTDHPETRDTAQVNLVAGTLYNIRMEYYQKEERVSAKLRWRYAGLPTQDIPKMNLYLPTSIDTFQTGNVSREKRVNSFRKSNHLSEIDVLNTDGRRYVYGIPVYNLKQKDVTFSVAAYRGNSVEGLVGYTPGVDNTTGNNLGNDNYFSKEEVPAYAHSFLLTGILSPDYVDLTGDGITADDPGDAIKFNYTKVAGVNNPEKWRAPYNDSATYNRGLRTDTRDDKGSYVYGEKELWYLNSIESKNMIATFRISNRLDMPAIDENGKLQPIGQHKQLDEINLYTKADFNKYGTGARPVKTVHFKYNYSLCKGMNRADPGRGKLTLEKVWFTYNGNEKSKERNAYIFNYNSKNPAYAAKNYDRWGNYKDPLQNPGSSATNLVTNEEYPYALQDSTLAAANAAAWTLDGITLPSGGRMKIEYESDDYAFVQNKRAAQMCRIAGFSPYEPTTTGGLATSMYGTFGECLYVAIHVPKPVNSNREVYTRYLEGMGDTLFFRAYVQMPTDKFGGGYEYVSCYATMAAGQYGYFNNGNTIWVKLEAVNKSGEVEDGAYNPIAKAAIQFLRLNLPSKAFPGSETGDTHSPEDDIKILFSQVTNILSLVQSFDAAARHKDWARMIDTTRSYVRLNNPYHKKYGGGLRVKRVLIYDHWDAMAKQKEAVYGQEYQYTTTRKILGVNETISSGVASFEPSIGGEENPWRMPIQYKEQAAVLAPVSTGYVEKPLGESFYPAPTVGYSKVRVRSVHTKNKRSANGYMETCFYTTYDFPTLTDMTLLADNKKRFKPTLSNLLRINARHYVAVSQGFKVELNDMNGKVKSQGTYGEADPDKPISYTENYYKVDDPRATFKHLNNTVSVIDSKGIIDTAASIGKDVELMMDMRQQRSVTNSKNVNLNGDGFLTAPPIFAFITSGLNLMQREETLFRSIGTTKIINRHGILDSILVIDKGSRVVTRNLLYDGETGNVLLTSTQNEFDDPVYHFAWPAAWAYDGMSGAYKNIGVVLSDVTIREGRVISGLDKAATDYFAAGDEILVSARQKTSGTDCAPDIATFPTYGRIYAVDANVLNGGTPDIYFVDRDGAPYTGDRISLKIIRSGRRNIAAGIGEVTLLSNPMVKSGNTYSLVLNENSKVLSAGAIEYQQFWKVADTKKAGTVTNCVQESYAVYAGDNNCGPHVYGNDVMSAKFTSDKCPDGSDSILYTIDRDMYSSTISQEDANDKARAALVVNGPVNASFYTTCFFPNVEMKRFYVRNNCPAGTIPDTVLYTVAAGKYKASTQEEANAQAAADTVVNGQAYANLNGSCRPCSYFITKKANSDPPGAFLVNFISDYIGGTTYTFPYSDGMFEQWPFCNIIPAGSYTVRVESMDRLYVTINGVEKQTNTPQTWPAVTPINIQVSTKSLFYNERFDATYTKNDCGTGYVGSSISYPIPAGVASSEISISDANQKAIALYAPSGQAAANATGTCMDATRVIIQRAPGKPAVSTTMRVKLTNSNGIEEMNRVLETDYELPISQVIPQGHHKVTIETMDKVVVSVNGVVKTVRTTETWDYVLGPPLLIEVWWE